MRRWRDASLGVGRNLGASLPWSLVLLLLAAPLDYLNPQESGALEGKVIEAETGRRLGGVTVTVLGAGLSTTTTHLGEYVLRGLPPGAYNVRVELDRYATAIEPVEVLAGQLSLADFRLVPLSAILDEVFVSASSDASAQIVELDGSAAASAIVALDGQVPGAVVFRPGGNIGAGMQIVIRGLKSFTQRHDPVILIDGVRVSDPNPTIRGARGMTALELLNPDQIDRIEVLTGPAAAIRYGLGARNGVILIYTRIR